MELIATAGNPPLAPPLPLGLATSCCIFRSGLVVILKKFLVSLVEFKQPGLGFGLDVGICAGSLLLAMAAQEESET